MDTYEVQLDHDEGQALRFLADRYDSAQYLFDYATYVGEDVDDCDMAIELDETRARVYLAHLVTENGNPDQTIPACAGGSLDTKLQALYDEITGG